MVHSSAGYPPGAQRDCLLTEVSRCKYRTELDITLKCLPSTLFGAYDRFLAAVPEKHQIYAMATLRWLIFAIEKLNLAQLADAISFDFSDPDQYTHEPDRRQSNASAIFDWLEGLVTKSTGQEDSVFVVLAHASVQEYTTSAHFHDKFHHTVACSTKHTSVVALLLQNGANPEILSPFGGSALTTACSSGNINIVRLLLASGANVNLQTARYGSALAATFSRFGLSSSQINIARLLIDRGADIDTGALGAACKVATSRSSAYWLNTGPTSINLTTPTAALWVVQLFTVLPPSGEPDVVRFLLESGADVNLPGGYFGSPLAWAFQAGVVPNVRLLLDNGADINSAAAEYGSALGAAASFFYPHRVNGYLEIVHLLFQRGADVRGHRNPALKLAVNLDFRGYISADRVRYGNVRSQIVDLLREMGAVLDSEDEGETGAQTE
ncbi:ankyrin repeat-containing domain protein [Mycena vulgaris]|nr:ankyrin repeat-containing domain protein [Mycena vulgaris]